MVICVCGVLGAEKSAFAKDYIFSVNNVEEFKN